jgi:hypothetical protein
MWIVFTARYALSPYIKQIRFVFKGLSKVWLSLELVSRDVQVLNGIARNYIEMYLNLPTNMEKWGRNSLTPLTEVCLLLH